MATLYELTDAYTELVDELQCAETDEEATAIMERMDALDGDIAMKADAYARVIKNLEADAAAYKAEKARLAGLQSKAEDSIKRMKERLLMAFTALSIKECPTQIGKWRVQKNPPSCEILNAAEVPFRFHIPQPDTIDKAAILKEFKVTGEILPGTDIVQKEGLRFK